MDPNFMMSPFQSTIGSQPFSGGLFLASIFANAQEQDDYLASLDSDTRDYVLKHTDDFRTKDDIIDCVNRLHGRS